MAKKRTRTWYINKLFDKAKKYVKERDNYICQYSGKKVSGSNCHCSHVLNRGHYAHAALDPFNMKTLSSYFGGTKMSYIVAYGLDKSFLIDMTI